MEREAVERLIGEINYLRETLAQKEQEIEKLKVSSLFLETLFDGIHEELMVIDQNFVIQDANKIFLEHYGLKLPFRPIMTNVLPYCKNLKSPRYIFLIIKIRLG